MFWNFFKIEGIIFKRFDTVWPKGQHFKRRREFLLKVEYKKKKQYISFKLWQNQCTMLDDLREGCRVVISFSIIGTKKEYEGEARHFVSLRVSRINGIKLLEYHNLEEHTPDVEEKDKFKGQTKLDFADEAETHYEVAVEDEEPKLEEFEDIEGIDEVPF